MKTKTNNEETETMRKRKSGSKSQSGFTLIELLVVISIIGILIGYR
jgi:prepilin-type N-terminal cleavage/methylation domain-containing protein